MTVNTSQSLSTLTGDKPPGTIFWLAPGIHKLSDGEFDQVHPKRGDTYIGAPGAVLDGRHANRYAFGGSASDVTIQYLTVTNFGKPLSNNNEGVVNHNSADGWTIANNTIRGNAGAGVMVGSRNVLRANCLRRNGQYGFSVYNPHGVTDVVITGNEITGNNTDDWEKVHPGCGCTGGGKFWIVTRATIRSNWIHDNRGAGLWADTNNVAFDIEGNYISDNDAEGIIYEISYNAMIRYNTFVRNGVAKGPSSNSFPTSAIYISESGSDSRVAGPYSDTFEITRNVFIDNWSGVILWENADRFAGSPANTSTDAGTLVNPGVVTAKSCNADTIDKAPYYKDCRWKTQNVHVHRNTFKLDPKAIGGGCAPSNGCGFNGIFSNWGTFPDWSPYKKEVIEDSITFKQDNRFSDNTYVGAWAFLIRDQSTKVNWATWQAAPYNQDTDSVIKTRPRPGR